MATQVEATAGQRGPRTAAPVRNRLALGAVLLATFTTQFNVTSVTVALPGMQSELAASYPAVQWVLAGYTLPLAVLLVAAGRTGDVAGRRRMFLTGVAGFTVASAFAAVATDIRLLIAARVLQGVSAAVLGPQVLALFRVLVPAAGRGRMLAVYGAVISVATVGGPVLGGLLVHLAPAGSGWRAVFAINVPLGLLSLAGGFCWLSESRAGDARRLELGQIPYATGVLLLIVYPLMHGREAGWPWWSWTALVAAVPALILFVRGQRRREREGGPAAALVPIHLFRSAEFTAGLAANFVVAALISGFFLTFVLFLQEGAGLSPAGTGATLASWALGTALSSVVAIPLARRRGRGTLVCGAVLMVLGMLGVTALLYRATGTPPAGWLFAALLLVGIGVGLVSAPILNVTLAVIPAADAGAAGGVFNTVKQTGAVFGVAVTGTVFFGLLGDRAEPSAAQYLDAMRLTALLQVAVCLGVLILVSRLRPPAVSPAAPAGPQA